MTKENLMLQLTDIDILTDKISKAFNAEVIAFTLDVMTDQGNFYFDSKEFELIFQNPGLKHLIVMNQGATPWTACANIYITTLKYGHDGIIDMGKKLDSIIELTKS